MHTHTHAVTFAFLFVACGGDCKHYQLAWCTAILSAVHRISVDHKFCPTFMDFLCSFGVFSCPSVNRVPVRFDQPRSDWLSLHLANLTKSQPVCLECTAPPSSVSQRLEMLFPAIAPVLYWYKGIWSHSQFYTFIGPMLVPHFHLVLGLNSASQHCKVLITLTFHRGDFQPYCRSLSNYIRSNLAVGFYPSFSSGLWK